MELGDIDVKLRDILGETKTRYEMLEAGKYSKKDYQEWLQDG